MLARALTVLVAATTIAAWPIAFYHSNDCRSEPVIILHEPPRPGSCGFVHRDAPPIKSYSGGTADNIQKMLLYYDRDLCHHDAGHRMHSNHTINNSPNACIPFKKKEEIPVAFTFIEEFIPIASPKQNVTVCNRLVVQT